MGISRDKAHKRRLTGGRVKRIRSKRKFELGRQPANTKLGEKKVSRVRVRGGHYKFRAIRLDHGNFNWAGEAVSRKTRILKVVYNATSNELVRTNTLVKGAIVQIDSAPFKQWYQKFYNVPLGKQKEGDAKAPRDINKGEKKKSTLRAYKKERKLAKLGAKKEAGLKGIEKKSTAQKRADAIEKKSALGKKVAAQAAKKGAALQKAGAAKKGAAKTGEKKPVAKKPADDKGAAAKKGAAKPAAGKGADKGAAAKKEAAAKPAAGKGADKGAAAKKEAAVKPAAKGADKGAAAKKEAATKPAAKTEVAKPAEKKPETAEKKPETAEKKTTETGEKKVKNPKFATEKKEGDLSDKLKNKLSQRNRIRVLENQLGDQFRTGRLYARISSRPGQSGRADGYILEGEELAFYLKKIYSKKKK